MSEGEVTFLLTKLGDFLADRGKQLAGVQGEAEYISDELEFMTAFLRLADAMEDGDPVLKCLIKKVRDAAYDTEDALDNFNLSLARNQIQKVWTPMNYNKLRSVIHEFLRKKKYLIVLDDVWHTSAWRAFQHALPNKICGGRILVTTRNTEVASTSCMDSLDIASYRVNPTPFRKVDERILNGFETLAKGLILVGLHVCSRVYI
ncbi:hypothetical protein POTOM_061742 [Populus tomentosa]|uniref:Disease resistance N-terminal domain-containing protein n=1 Tax=Populus tomentosa TaxID=118781 RepID=A0A8X7XS13_POPTO|nr:hypothetical protein POTOM_061742 [Populus tomentosa]